MGQEDLRGWRSSFDDRLQQPLQRTPGYGISLILLWVPWTPALGFSL